MEVVSVLSSLLVPVLLLACLWLLYKLLKLTTKVLGILRDYFVLWHIAFGAHPSRRVMGKTMRQHAYVCATHLLDSVAVRELYEFGKTMVQTDITVEAFHKVVLGYTYAVMCRERMDGSLRGIYLMGKEKKVDNNTRYTVIKVGLALIRNSYRGGPLIYYVFLWHAIKELIRHPRTPVYLMGKAFSHISYVALFCFLSEVYPRYDQETPDRERRLIHEFARSVQMSNEVYNPDTFVLERELSNLKSHAAPLADSDLANPHIRFFVDNNPGWCSGHCMFFIAKITWNDIFRIIWKSVKRAQQGRNCWTDRTPPRTHPGFSRHMSFQEEAARKYALKHCEVDLMGNVLHKKESDPSFVTVDEEPDDNWEFNASE